jgi:hemerythrin
MTSSAWNTTLNPSVDIVYLQRKKIFECMTTIYHKIVDSLQECYPINDLLDQLKQLCQIHFLYVEQLLEELNHVLVTEDKHLHEKFLASIDRFEIENNQRHTSTIIYDFTYLRLELISYLLNEAIMICNFVKSNYV